MFDLRPIVRLSAKAKSLTLGEAVHARKLRRRFPAKAASYYFIWEPSRPSLAIIEIANRRLYSSWRSGGAAVTPFTPTRRKRALAGLGNYGYAARGVNALVITIPRNVDGYFLHYLKAR